MKEMASGGEGERKSGRRPQDLVRIPAAATGRMTEKRFFNNTWRVRRWRFHTVIGCLSPYA